MIVINDNYKSAIVLRCRCFCSLLYHVEPLTLREQRCFYRPSMRRSFHSELALPSQSSSKLNSCRPCNHKVSTLFMAQWVSSMGWFTPGATKTRTDTTSCLWQLKQASEIDGFCQQQHLTQPHKCSNKWADKEFKFLCFWRRGSHPLLTTCCERSWALCTLWLFTPATSETLCSEAADRNRHISWSMLLRLNHKGAGSTLSSLSSSLPSPLFSFSSQPEFSKGSFH